MNQNEQMMQKYGGMTLHERAAVGIQQGLHYLRHGNVGKRVKWVGLGTFEPSELAHMLRAGWHRDKAMLDGWIPRQLNECQILLLPKANLVVNSGINIGLDRTIKVATLPVIVDKMGVDAADVTNVDPTSTTSSSGTNKKTIIAFDGTNATRTGQVTTPVGTFTQANVNFIMKRLFLTNTAATLTNSATADDANSLYAMTARATLDLTPFASWTQVFSPTVTGTGS